MRFNSAVAACALAAASIFGSSAALADKGCKNLQSRCAIQVGGKCDPVSGHWDTYPHQQIAFNACLAKGKK
jgi:hypothetical protein